MNHNEAVLKAIKDILGTSPDPESKEVGSLTLTEDQALAIFVGCPDKRYTVVAKSQGVVKKVKSFKQWGSLMNYINTLQANDLPFMVYDYAWKKGWTIRHRSEDVMKYVWTFAHNTLGIEMKENTND